MAALYYPVINRNLIGRSVFDVFPDNPNDPEAMGAHSLEASLRRALATGEPDTMALQRYDVESPEPPHRWQHRFWSPVNVPILDAEGRVVLLAHRSEEVTGLIYDRARAQSDPNGVLESDLYNRSRELKEANEQRVRRTRTSA